MGDGPFLQFSAETSCTCHSHVHDTGCALWKLEGVAHLLSSVKERSRQTPIVAEVSLGILEELVSRWVRCGNCRQECMEILRSLAANPSLRWPVECRVSPDWSGEDFVPCELSGSPNDRSKVLVIVQGESANTISGAPSIAAKREEVYQYLCSERIGQSSTTQGTSGEESLAQFILRSSGPRPSDQDDVGKYIRGLLDSATNAMIHEEALLGLLLNVERTYEATTAGYSFIRIFQYQSPTASTVDVVYRLNCQRQEQANLSIQSLEYLRTSTMDVAQTWNLVLKEKVHECIIKSIKLLETPEVREALKYGLKIHNLVDSFVYRQLRGVSPLHWVVSYIFNVRDSQSSQGAKALVDHVSSMVKLFLDADRWHQFETDCDTLSSFSGGLLSVEKRRFIVSEPELMTLLSKRTGAMRRFVIRHDMYWWFGVNCVPDAALEEAAQRFWEARVGKYRQTMHSFLHTFVASSNVEGNPWALARAAADAIFSVKIGMCVYGELDWLLARFSDTRSCKISRIPDAAIISKSLSHVLGKVLLTQLAGSVSTNTPHSQAQLTSQQFSTGISSATFLPHLPMTFTEDSPFRPPPISTGAVWRGSEMPHPFRSSPNHRLGGPTASGINPVMFASSASSLSPNAVSGSATTNFRTMTISPVVNRPESPHHVSSPLSIDGKGPLNRAFEKRSTLMRTSSSSQDQVPDEEKEDDPELARRRGLATRRGSPPQLFQEEWFGKTSCTVRMPATWFPFLTEGDVLRDIADKTQTVVEVLRTGKVMVAASAFRVQGRTNEAVVRAVAFLRDYVPSLGLVEQKYRVTRKSAAKIVGKGGEKISSMRQQSGCRIFLSETEEGLDTSLVILFGKSENVAEALKLLKRVVPDIDSASINTPSNGGSVAANPRFSAVFKSSSSVSDDELSSLYHQPPTPANSVGPATRSRFLEVRASGDSEFSTCSDGDDYRGRSRGMISPGKSSGEDALFKAVQHRDWVMAAQLAERGEGLMFMAASGTGVLHKAAERNAPDSLILTLVAKGLDPAQSVVKKGYTPLHFAVQGTPRPSLVETLLKAGANPNKVDDFGMTSLHIAVSRNVAPRVVEVLLNHGADVSIRDKAGMSTLDLAVNNNASKDILALLKRAG